MSVGIDRLNRYFSRCARGKRAGDPAPPAHDNIGLKLYCCACSLLGYVAVILGFFPCPLLLVHKQVMEMDMLRIQSGWEAMYSGGFLEYIRICVAS